MIRKVALGLLGLALSAAASFAQTAPNWSYKYVPTVAEWNALFAGKQDYLGAPPLLTSGGTMLGKLVTAASTTANAGLNLIPGVAPTSPINGDLWTTNGGVFARISGTTIGPLTGPASNSFASTSPIAVSFPAGVVTYSISNGTSVANPGTGTLETLLPIQTTTGASKTFAASDLFKETRRSNSGSAMTDTFPASSATGMVNGAKIVVTNVDATANDTITAGAGTTISGTGVVAAGRAIQYVYDAPNTIWRPTLNTGTALLGPVTPNAVLVGGSVVNTLQYASPPAVAGCLTSTGTGSAPSFGASTFSQCGPTSYVNTMAGLRAIPAGVTPNAYVVSYYAPAAGAPPDGGGGWFFWNGASAEADNGGTVIRPDTLPATGRWQRVVPQPGVASIRWFGAKGDGSDATTTTAAILATAAWLGNDSTLLIPTGNYLCSSRCFNYLNGAGIKIQGFSAGNSAFPQTSIVTYTGSIGHLASFDGTEGVEISNVAWLYNNPAYADDLVDLRQGAGGGGTASIHIHDFVFSGIAGSATSANSLIRVGGTLKAHVHDGFMQFATRGFHNSGLEGAAYSIELSNIWWQNLSNQPITMAGTAWSVHNNDVEPPVFPGPAGWIIATGICEGCRVDNNNAGDATNLGTWVDLSAGGFEGGGLNANMFSTGLRHINLGASKGITLNNKHYIAAAGAIVASSATQAQINGTCSDLFPGTNPCTALLSGAAPASSTYDNQDGTGTHITNGLTVTGSFTATGLVTNADLANPSTTVNGQTCTLGATCTLTAVASSIVVGTTGVTSGTTLGVLYNNAGTLGNTAAGTNGQLFLGVTSGAPAFATMSSDATITNAGVLTIANGVITYTKIGNIGALSVMGRSANSSGVGDNIQATAASGGVLRESGSTIGFGTIATAGIADNAVTLAKMATQATNTVLVNATSGSAVPTAQAVSSCSSASSALIWTTNTGFGCNTAITANAVAVGGITGLGVGVATALAINPGTNGSIILNGGNLGTPSAGAIATTLLTGALQAAQEPAHTGDVTNTAGSLITLLANIPTGVPAAGSILFTNIAAPSSPAAGKVSVYTDSTDLRLHDKNASGVVGTTVVADTGASNQFLTAISAAGAISKAQPSFSNLSGSVAASQMPALTGACTTSAGAVATTCIINTTINGGGATFTIVAGATGWVGIGLICNSTEAACNIPQPQAGTISNFYLSLIAAPGAGQTYTVTMRKNTSSQTVTCTVSGASATTCNDTTHSFTVAAADNVTIQIVSSASAATIAVASFGYKLATTSP